MELGEIVAPGTEPNILGTGFGFCEGPAADPLGNVYFSDGENDSIYCCRLAGSVDRFVDDSTDANGMMFNSRGELYVCLGPTGLRIYGAAAEPLGAVDLPYASNCCFGGEDLRILFVTSADKLLGLRTKVRGATPPGMRGT